MIKSREMIYLNLNSEENCIFSYGIEFKEFMNSLEEPIDNLLVLAGEYTGVEFNYQTRCEYVTKENMPSILEENVYMYGDFCWVDFANEASLEKLTPQEVADLLYLGRLMKPVNSPFFERLNNRFAYLAHDDGWFNKFYCRDMKDFSGMLSNLIPTKVKYKIKRRVIPNVSPEISRQLLEFASEGLLIDFDNIFKDKGILEVPVYIIGKFTDMDSMYNDLQRHQGKAKYEARLVLKNKNWSIVNYS